jgi:hypothetical protein
MLNSFLLYIGMGLIMASSMLLLMGQNRRFSLFLLVVQYLAVFFLISQIWSLGLAFIKALAGWMGVITLTATVFHQSETPGKETSVSSRFFRFLLGLIIWILIFTITPLFTNWLPIPNVFLWSGCILLGIGLLQVGIFVSPLRVVMGLLTMISGFEVVYAAVENSTLVTALLAAITLGLSAVGAYLSYSTRVEEHP